MYTSAQESALRLLVWAVVVVPLVIVIAVHLGDLQDLSHGATVLAAFAAVAALLGPALVPTSAATATTPACRNTQVAGTSLQATTRSGEPTIVYAGPGRDFPVKQSLAPGCTVGFRDYCIGQFVGSAELSSGLRDSRWLRLPHNRGFVASHDVVAQSDYKFPASRKNCPESSPFPTAPRVAISKYSQIVNGAPEPAIHFGFIIQDSDLVPAITGLALARKRPGDEDYAYLPLGVADTYKQSSEGFKDLSRSYLRTDQTAYVAMVSCLAVGAPLRESDKSYALVKVDPSNVQDATPGAAAPPGLDSDRLLHAACIPPPGG